MMSEEAEQFSRLGVISGGVCFMRMLTPILPKGDIGRWDVAIINGGIIQGINALPIGLGFTVSGKLDNKPLAHRNSPFVTR
jgi:hypothetical protein